MLSRQQPSEARARLTFILPLTNPHSRTNSRIYPLTRLNPERDRELTCACTREKEFFVSTSIKRQNGKVTVGDLPPLMVKLKAFSSLFKEEEITGILSESYPDLSNEIEVEDFLRAYVNLQGRVTAKSGQPKQGSSFLNATTPTLLHTISESEKASYVAHINSYLGDDKFLKQFLPLDPSTNDLFDLAKDGVLLCKLINVAVPGTIDERAINMKRVLSSKVGSRLIVP